MSVRSGGPTRTGRIAAGLLVTLACGCSTNVPTVPGDGGGDSADIAGLDANSAEGGSGEAGAVKDGAADAPWFNADAIALNCAALCHGSTTNEAPPLGVKGQTATSVRGVGAHQVHLKSSTWHVQFECADCHSVPKTVTATGHIDTALPAEVVFSAVAKTKGAKPTWSGTTCSGTYCHGATQTGGKITAPVWTQVTGAQVLCDSCHGNPPTKGHTASNTQCSSCHAAVVNSANKIIAPKLHIDGKISATGSHPTGYNAASVHSPDFYKDPSACKACHGSNLTGGSAKGCDSCHKIKTWLTSCTYCHGGTDNQTGAPPEDVAGKTATTVPGVGRHSSHAADGASHVAFSCAMCHGKTYTSALDPGHLGLAPADIAFTGLAKGSSYSFTTYWCSNVYCHGNGKPGSSGKALWIGSLSGGCSACHDDQTAGSGTTLSGKHKKHLVDKGLKCNDCHQCVVNGSNQIISKAKHVNGTIDICAPTWNASQKSCSSPGSNCHDGKAESW
jgi:predicted CxxxxCH...CXXCH cytochrome family protein